MVKVIIYSTKTCPYCILEKQYLKSKGVEFEEILLDEHPEKIEEAFKTCQSQGVPCTHITQDDGSEEKILGFDKPKIDVALGLA